MFWWIHRGHLQRIFRVFRGYVRNHVTELELATAIGELRGMWRIWRLA